MRFLVLACLVAGWAAAVAAEPVDWSAIAETEVVEILTTDADGEARETKIWFIVLEAAGYVRTSDSRWLANIRRDANVGLRVGEQTLELRATELGEEPELRERIHATFNEKYGWLSRLMAAFRFREPNVLKLVPR